MSDNKYLLDVRGLKQHFPIVTGFFKTTMLRAVDGVSFRISPGETLGLVGESGCGKTTVGRTLLHLYQPTAGEIWFDGTRIEKGPALDMLRRRAQLVFQDPYSALNPRMTVSDIVAEPLDVHRLYSNKKERSEKVQSLLTLVGLSSEQASRYAHEFSGGQRQRIGIARALASNPEFIVCDEPVSALDVSIQAQVLNTLEDLQSRLGLSYLFIAHDLSVVKHISNRIAVMYLGRIVELASSTELHRRAAHPYTQSLLSAVPVPDPDRSRKTQRIILGGDVPSPLNVPSGCSFRTRCPIAQASCAQVVPELREIAPQHYAACQLI
ncbi:ABC transporter ATP-binding protein [Clostridia bacterium]|nr:ABC transporter ATP-binding protein [Clostridia bacterium]